MAQGQEMGFEYTSLSRSWSFGRKRVFVANHMEVDSCFTTPKKKHCRGDSVLDSEKSALDSLPQDILVSPFYFRSCAVWRERERERVINYLNYMIYVL